MCIVLISEQRFRWRNSTAVILMPLEFPEGYSAMVRPDSFSQARAMAFFYPSPDKSKFLTIRKANVSISWGTA